MKVVNECDLVFPVKARRARKVLRSAGRAVVLSYDISSLNEEDKKRRILSAYTVEFIPMIGKPKSYEQGKVVEEARDCSRSYTAAERALDAISSALWLFLSLHTCSQQIKH